MITLQVNGRKMSFTEKELTAILEEYYDKKIERPTEGEWFQVKPMDIDRELFKEERRDAIQESLRRKILKAFDQIKDNPKYAEPFETMYPEKTWDEKNFEEFQKMAIELGDGITDYVEQCLEWAQRISNGEEWWKLCNVPDITKWFRVILGENGMPCLIGGGRLSDSIIRYTSVRCHGEIGDYKYDHYVPSIVRRKK